MTIGERIKERRKKLGLSVEELADKLGKNRATIYRYESSEIEKLPTTVLKPLAKALNTTPAFLMGWDETEDAMKPTFPPQRRRIRGAVKGKIIKKLAPDEVGNEPIAIKATKSEWERILDNMSDESRQKLQDYAELLLLKQDQGDSED